MLYHQALLFIHLSDFANNHRLAFGCRFAIQTECWWAKQLHCSHKVPCENPCALVTVLLCKTLHCKLNTVQVSSHWAIRWLLINHLKLYAPLRMRMRKAFHFATAPTLRIHRRRFFTPPFALRTTLPNSPSNWYYSEMLTYDVIKWWTIIECSLPNGFRGIAGQASLLPGLNVSSQRSLARSIQTVLIQHWISSNSAPIQTLRHCTYKQHAAPNSS